MKYKRFSEQKPTKDGYCWCKYNLGEKGIILEWSCDRNSFVGSLGNDPEFWCEIMQAEPEIPEPPKSEPNEAFERLKLRAKGLSYENMMLKGEVKDLKAENKRLEDEVESHVGVRRKASQILVSEGCRIYIKDE